MLERNSYNPSRNNGLGLARYILKELNNNRILHINLGSKQFDNNKKFVQLHTGISKRHEMVIIR